MLRISGVFTNKRIRRPQIIRGRRFYCAEYCLICGIGAEKNSLYRKIIGCVDLGIGVGIRRDGLNRRERVGAENRTLNHKVISRVDSAVGVYVTVNSAGSNEAVNRRRVDKHLVE